MAKRRALGDDAEAIASKATLLRLANSCARLATRGSTVTPIAHDLDAADYQTMAEVLHGMAAMIPDSTDGR